MKSWLVGFCTLFLVGCVGVISDQPVQPVQNSRQNMPIESPNIPTTQTNKMELNLENYGPAPELTNEVWLNTEQPLRLSDLRGKVVLLDMWTFG